MIHRLEVAAEPEERIAGRSCFAALSQYRGRRCGRYRGEGRLWISCHADLAEVAAVASSVVVCRGDDGGVWDVALAAVLTLAATNGPWS